MSAGNNQVKSSIRLFSLNLRLQNCLNSVDDEEHDYDLVLRRINTVLQLVEETKKNKDFFKLLKTIEYLRSVKVSFFACLAFDFQNRDSRGRQVQLDN